MPSTFVQAVTPAVKSLFSAEGRFMLLNLSAMNTSSILDELEHLEALEQAIMVVWAESTVLINTGFYADVKRGRVKFTRSDRNYLIQILAL